ncbi:MAG: PKD domain-containing protein [Bacteroidota bacterium]|nr:PKD domain-containing protein [Bacteroidota bacterium]
MAPFNLKNTATIILIAFFLIPYGLNAQFSSDFNASPTQGCSPLLVTFTPTYQSATSYHWSFGNSNGSDSMIVIATYVASGSSTSSFTVSLTVTEGANTSTSTQTITVFPDPVAGFFVSDQSNTGCVPLTTNFTDNSSATGANIISWYWDFGDGSSATFSTGTDPSHVYTFGGFDYSVSLEVTDANGCTNLYHVPNFVHPSGLPIISFSADTTQFCQLPAPVQFLNYSAPFSGSGSLFYVWDFGDGSPTSNLAEPNHVYTNYQYYDVSLTATDANGCTETKTYSDFIKVEIVNANFSIPDTVCAGDTFLIDNQSLGANQYSWDFFTGTSSDANPEYVYPVGNTYPINLTASLGGNCADTETHIIFVESINANIFVNPWYVCILPTDVSLIDLSVTNNTSGIADWFWRVAPPDTFYAPDPTPADTHYVQNPVQTVNGFLGGDLCPPLEQYHNETYFVTLVATSPFGCKDTVTDSIVTYLPIAEMDIIPLGGCAPININFLLFTVYDSPYDSIVSFDWTFSNGSAYSGLTPPSIMYTDTGYFPVMLTTTTQMGCVYEDIQYIQIGMETFPDFLMLTDDSICASDTVLLLDLSQPSSIIDYTKWEFSAGNSYDYQNSTVIMSPLYLGWFDLNLISVHNMCVSDTFVDSLFYVLGPIGYGESEFDCDQPYLYHFSPNNEIVDTIMDATSFYWDFGDGNFDSINIVTDYLYAANNDTFAHLILENDTNGCQFIHQIPMFVNKPLAKFSMDSSLVCHGYNVLFTPDSSDFFHQTQYGGGTFGYYIWNFDDGETYSFNGNSFPDTITSDTISHSFTQAGEYWVSLFVEDQNECQDSVRHRVRVLHPVPEPIITPPSGCTPITCTFTDNTQADTTLVAWQWIFGQGDTSYLQNPPGSITYYNDSTYILSFTITDTVGCTGTTIVEILASTPIPDFTADDKFVCLGDTVYFNNESVFYGSNPQFIWDFDDGNTSTETGPWHLYSQAGLFNIGLTVNDGGCMSDTIFDNFIIVQDPTCIIDVDCNGNHCAPVIVDSFFTIPDTAAYMHDAYTYLWDFGNGPISYEHAPNWVFNESGNYPVSLSIYTNACPVFRPDTIWFEVIYAYADLQLSDDKICLGETIQITVNDTNNVESFFIDYGDGTSGNSLISNHEYNIASAANSLTVWLHYANGECPYTDSEILQIYEVRANFLRGPNDEDTASCYSITVDFIDESIGGNSWYWDFGDGNVSPHQNATHTFSDPGIYEVSHLVGNTEYSCTVTYTDTIWVYPAPTIYTETYSEICYGDSVQLDASGGITYQWSPADYLSDVNIPNPVATPPYSFEYNIHITDEKLCENEELVYVFVQTMPALDLSDTTIVVGDILDLSGNPLYNVEYSWTPPDNLSCPSCYSPGFQPMHDTMYYVTMTATANGEICYIVEDSLFINVDWIFSVDIPDLFTPNGDGNNDIVYAEGWGIKQILEFKIFNRWGEKVFHTDDIKQGWDGTYKGMLQPIDTYVYMVKVEFWDNKTRLIQGTINLMR